MKVVICDLLGLTYDGNTLKTRGLGGSESAVILLSKELVKLGIDVTVFNNCIDSQAAPGVYDGVRYIDHSQISEYQDTPDIFIASRSLAPFWANNTYSGIAFSSKKRVLWMHDTFAEGESALEDILVSGYIDEVFTLSDFHTNYALNCEHGNKRNFEVLKHKFWQTRNGAVRHIDEVDLSKKDPNHYVYNASVTKGLIPLLTNIWPEVKRIIPDAHLTVIGGYYRFREGAEPDQQEQTLKKLMEEDHEGVTFTGVIPQFKIAEILANASYMLYPTAFPETFGISSLESLLYKTPLITSRFGALEETAIDLACYKIDYSATSNSLFPNINEEEQTNLYIETIFNAYNNPYLHQQKQNYCNVINDVHGWDTIALQWKQHFYNMLDRPLPVDEYRRVSLINDKVSRVFGRRYNNIEQQKEYRSYGPQRRIVVISPFWNAEDYIERNIRSVASQDYDNYLHILINDASTDSSLNVVKNAVNEFPNYNFKLVNNKTNKGAILNQLTAVQEYVNNDDIVVLLDGDDWLVNNNTIFHYYNDLYNRGYEFTYGSMWSIADNIPLIAQEYPNSVKANKSYKQHLFNWKIPYTHLRTVLGKHFCNIDCEKFKDSSGNWMKSGADNPLFYELIEQVEPSKVYCNQEIVCNYNDINPLNDFKIRGTEQNQNADRSYQQEKHMTTKKILIGIPTNKYIETETFKSIFDLEVPPGYELDFQYFYGYQIDQIRNLIAEWAKNYDYLFSVDSDIILPQDSLKKMIEADKDIVSGLYIQRIPNTHTLEVYMDTPDGGCTNIPYETIADKSLLEIAACGMGCVLIKGEVFRKMKYPHFYYQSSLNHQETVSEDVYFCMKAKSLGFKIWADPSIKCDHIGSTHFRVDTEKKVSHLEKVATVDLLPKPYADYLKNMKIEPRIVYDIGACVLHWTRKAKEAWPKAEYYLVDAANSVQPFLEKSGHEWAISVLSSSDGKIVDFYENKDNPGGNSYYLETTGAFNDSHKTRRLTLTLDSLAKQNNWKMPDLIKMDVQGAELDILKGASDVLKTVEHIFLELQSVEYNKDAPLKNQVIAYMKEIGFELVAQITDNGPDGDYHFKRA